MQALLDSLMGTSRQGRRWVGSRVITVCHPIWRLARAGLEGQMMQTIQRLPADRFRHVVIVRDGKLGEAIVDGNVTIIHADEGRDRWWAMRLAAVCREECVDVLHVRGLGMLMDGALAAQLCPRARLAFSFHGLDADVERMGAMRKRGLRWSLARCAARWAVSASAAEAVANLLGEPAESFAVMPNGVDTERFSPAEDRMAARASLGLSRDRVICLCVANLKPVKGQDVLLSAAAMRPEWKDRVTIVLAGGDYWDGTVQAQAARELSGFDVRFVGEVSDILPYYHAADVFVLPSRSEGLSNAMLEAMACGLPVVATDVGAAREVLGLNASGPEGQRWLPGALAPGMEVHFSMASGGRTDASRDQPRPPCRAEMRGGDGVQGLKSLATIVRPTGEEAIRAASIETNCGVIVPPQDANALAAAMDRVIADAAFRHQLGAAARARVVERYDARSTAARYAAACTAIATRPDVPRRDAGRCDAPTHDIQSLINSEEESPI